MKINQRLVKRTASKWHHMMLSEADIPRHKDGNRLGAQKRKLIEKQTK